VEDKVLGHLVCAEHFADPHTDLGGIGESTGQHRGGDRGQRRLGRFEQPGAFAGSFLG